MCGTNTPEELTLTPVGGASCACCATDSTATDSVEAPAGGGTQFAVSGLTCGSCVRKVETAVAGIDGVESAVVDLVAGGASTLTVAGTANADAVTRVVEAAGYSITAR
ncbi:heavy-metal-associated domain-containing protein [Arthrobacter sp. 35W]|uniref:heavy-metal-associated domain-containing protein n=1 Tax=Arthrobacter sp. 35W TaxID=1132441 RepID=UPI0003F84CB3|nr:heavy metal-associated domain-containing protein [Arthrobacter sp. 35W]